MTDVVFMAHSGLRYLVLATAIVAIVTAVMGIRRTGPAPKIERIAGAAFTGLLDLQVLLGLVLLLLWDFYGQLMGHVSMMVLALATVHVARVVARKREPERSGAGVRLAGYVTGLALMVAGIMAIGRPVV